jgi:hypothetical protein
MVNFTIGKESAVTVLFGREKSVGDFEKGRGGSLCSTREEGWRLSQRGQNKFPRGESFTHTRPFAIALPPPDGRRGVQLQPSLCATLLRPGSLASSLMALSLSLSQ